MSEEPERIYFIAAGRSLAAIEKWVDSRKETSKQIRAFRNRFGAKEAWTSEAGGMLRLCGLGFSGAIPKGWVPRQSFWVPEARNNAGKALRREMDDIRSDFIGEEAGGWCVGLQQLDGKWVITTREGATVPADGIPIKASEFWRMKEESDATKKGEVAR